MRARACRIQGEVSEAVEAARNALLNSGELAAEIRVELDHLVAANPSNAVARLGRAAASMKLQELDDAARDLSEALRFDSACADSVVALAEEILDRRPSFSPAARALADALRTSGDSAGAARALDVALATPEAATDLELIMARRELALRDGDAAGAARLLARAEKAAANRDQFLEQLHREALQSPAMRVSSNGRPEVTEAMTRAQYARALEMLAEQPASPLKAWVLERCGRWLEAGAILAEMVGDDGASSAYASMLNRLVARELEGRAPCLMGETTLEFHGMASVDEIPSTARRADEAAQGGMR